jgi:hypothetical protein
MAPDAANIWSWSKEVNARHPTLYTESVLVDFYGNDRMDTEYESLRVLITDAQVHTATQNSFTRIWISDETCRRWLLWGYPGDGSQVVNASHHFQTPILLPVNSQLLLEFETQNNGAPIQVNLIGRVITL